MRGGEFGRVPRKRSLPGLPSPGGPTSPSPAAAAAAWLHFADEAQRFNAALAGLAGEDRARRCGAVRLLVERPEWARQWREAELRAAMRLLDAAVEADGAWEGETGGEGAAVFCGALTIRPTCAPRVLAIILQAAARAEPLPSASHRRSFLRDVPAQLASDFLAHVARRVRGASAFGDPAAPDSLRRFAQCVGAVRVLEAGLEALQEQPQLWEAERATGKETAPGVFAAELAQCAARLAEWLESMADALSRQFELLATPRMRASRLGPMHALLHERSSLAASLAFVAHMLEPAQFARVWRLVAAHALAFLSEELAQAELSPEEAAAAARDFVRDLWRAVVSARAGP